MHYDLKLADLKVALGHNTLMEVSDPLILDALVGCRRGLQDKCRNLIYKEVNNASKSYFYRANVSAA